MELKFKEIELSLSLDELISLMQLLGNMSEHEMHQIVSDKQVDVLVNMYYKLSEAFPVKPNE